jgi:kinetochore protein NDC80
MESKNRKGRASNIFSSRSDPRPLSDKSFQLQCQKRLLEYLQQADCDAIQTLKQLQTPSAKDFMNVLMFLLKKIDPSYEILGKIDEEVPNIFKRLGYPFAISKNSLLAVGAPNTWANLLGALTWLMELVLYCENSTQDFSSPNLPNPTDRQISTPYILHAYELFLAHKDKNEELDELRHILQTRKEQKLLEMNILSEKITVLRYEKDDLRQAEKEYQMLDNRINLLTQEISNRKSLELLVSRRDNLANQLSFLKDEVEVKAEEIEILRKDLADINSSIKTQTYTWKDMEGMQMEIAQTELEIDSYKRQRGINDKLYWEVCQNYRALLHALRNLITTYNATATEIMLIPSIAKYAMGHDFEIILNEEALTKTPISENVVMNISCLENLKEALNNMNNIIDEKCSKKNVIYTSLEKDNMSKSEDLQELEEKEHDFQRVEEEFKSRLEDSKAFSTDCLEKKQQEAKDLDTTIRSLHESIHSITSDVLTRTEDLERLELQIQTLQTSMRASLSEATSIIRKDLQFLLAHKVNVLEYMDNLESYSDSQLREVIQIRI